MDHLLANTFEKDQVLSVNRTTYVPCETFDRSSQLSPTLLSRRAPAPRDYGLKFITVNF